MIHVVRKRLAAAKVAVVATTAVLVAGGGVAFAASSGHLPEVLGGDHQSDTGAKHSAAAPGRATPIATSTPSGSSEPTGGPTPVGTPSPSLRGLCNAFQKGATSNPGKAADNPAFAALAAAAGGTDNVAAYCLELIGAPGSRPTDPRSSTPTKPAHPTQAATPTTGPKAPNPNKPTAKPSRGPSTGPKAPNPNKPSAKPSKAPNPNKPTQAPRG